MQPSPIEKPLPRANLTRIDSRGDRPAAAALRRPLPAGVEPLMTPARRAALDALEREYAESLKASHV
jgi:hypothetical protein